MILIYSGGLDSTTLLYDFQKSIDLAVSFDYGSKHNKRELEFAKYHTYMLDIDHLVIDMRSTFKIFQKSTLLERQKDIEIPNGEYQKSSMEKTSVPFRNGIMLAVGIGIAEERSIRSVYLANHRNDHSIYPDCSAAFIESMSDAAMAGTYKHIIVVSPYQGKTKRQVALIGRSIGIDYSKTWSCYRGRDIHCGTCATCLERKEALEGFDTTQYEK